MVYDDITGTATLTPDLVKANLNASDEAESAVAGMFYKDTVFVAKFKEKPKYEDVYDQPLNEQARIENKLRVFVLARVVNTSTKDADKAKSVFGEQNGPTPNERENYALPGTDADRDYFFGEDDRGSAQYPDGNTADGLDPSTWGGSQAGTWVILGDPAGYPVRDKTNTRIDT